MAQCYQFNRRYSLYNMYSKIYIDFSGGKEELIRDIKHIINGTHYGIRSVKSNVFDIDINVNKEHKKREFKDDDFIYFKYYLDVEPLEGIDSDMYLFEMKKFLVELRIRFIEVTISSDFESVIGE